MDGFKKVDPDRWEFANEWFLRGQKPLLKNIVRRKHPTRAHHHHLLLQGDDLDDQELLAEIERLREEQRCLEEELKGMNQRLEVTEKRPQQMMAFLCKVAEDPDILTRVIMERDHKTTRHCLYGGGGGGEKRPRLVLMSSTSTSSDVAQSNSEEEGGGSGGAGGGGGRAILSPNANFEVDAFPSYNSPSSSDTCQSHEQSNWASYGPFSLGSDLGSLDVGPISGNLHHMGMEHTPNYMPILENTPPYPHSFFGGEY
ncbi:hypothetical protein Cgig2_018657 [Carnegiea gigantea]|uniref:Uncharacterized protein n=1 Tax=Carnegiea gigantea TaxID=171969 RepID=A0A9Q1KGH2_9CARY|nr:hypothetical protein Cgig2_018657 [Carnegiea gigantea]